MPGTERNVDTETSMGIAWETQLPLCWSPEPPPESVERPAETDLRIEETLQAVSGLEDMRATPVEEASTAGPALARIEFRLNLVLELLGELLSQTQNRPPAHRVQIGARRVTWKTRAEQVPVPGETGRLDLYLHPLYSRPLRLPGRIDAVDRSGDSHQVTLSLFELDLPAQEALERWIFMHHRRAVAQARPGKV